jgi:polyisoprenyl-phosphate glycosyltransferase
MSHPDFEIVIPVWNEQEVLPRLRQRVTAAADKTGLSWRIVVVDDGSTDATPNLLSDWHREDPRVGYLRLSRNFGHQAAVRAGLEISSAPAVVLMDADLQDPPELIPEMVTAWQEGSEVVIGRRRSRREKGLRRVGFELFHANFRFISELPIPANVGTFGLLSRRAVTALNSMPETHRFFPGLRHWIGFRQTFLEYDRDDRAAGKPKQNLRRLLNYAFDAVFSFSEKPLRYCFFVGASISASGFVLALFFIIKRLMGAEEAEMGFTTLVTLVLMLGGGQLMATGLIGVYLGRVYGEVKRRPLFFEDYRVGLDDTERTRPS